MRVRHVAVALALTLTTAVGSAIHLRVALAVPAPGRVAATWAAPARALTPTSRCASPAPRTAAGYQRMFDAKNDNGWSGGDQAASLSLPDGRVLWLFGDTMQGAQRPDGAYVRGSRMVHNSFLLQDGGCLDAVNGLGGAEVVPNAANGDWYWPQSALLEHGHLVVVVARTTKTGPGSTDFRTVGTDAAVFSLQGGRPVFERMAALPSSDVPEGGAEYGAALLPGRHWTYVYGTARGHGRLAFGKAVTVARVASGHFLDLAAWRYWDGRTWTREQDSAAQVVSAEHGGFSTAFSALWARDGAVRFVTKANDFVGRDVVTGTSASAVAPIASSPVAAYPSGRVPGEVLYNPLAHPEVRLADGSLLLTICRNSTDPRVVLAHADLYKPQFFTAPAA